MSLSEYFNSLKKKVEDSDLIQNNGKDKNGFFLPTRTVLLRNLQLLHDLYNKPLAKERVRDAWNFVAEHVPPDWLVLNEEDRRELQKVLKA